MSVSIDLSEFKSAGVYTVEIDNTVSDREVSSNPLRMIVGFANKGVFNRPVLLQTVKLAKSIYGDIDLKLEHKGSFFNRGIQTLLQSGPILALNLLPTDDSYNGKDLINWAAMSLNSGKANPTIEGTTNKYGEYDYSSKDGKIIPYIGQTPFASVYNRSRFWVPDKDLLTAVAARGLATGDDATFEHTNLLNFANVGTEEMSILIYKPTNVNGYDITIEQWYGGKENIPFGWLRPYDMVSDYFIQVICVKGNWTNYPVLSTDPTWSTYFDKNGIKKNKINNFLYAEGVVVLGSWQGIIIPDFIDKQGNVLSIERKINNTTETTGLLMSFNNDALNVLNWDLTGENNDGTGEKGCAVCGIDIDGNNEIENGESLATYTVDMVGHEAFMDTSVITDTSILDLPSDVQVINSFTKVGTNNLGQFVEQYEIDLDLLDVSTLKCAVKNNTSIYLNDINTPTNGGIYIGDKLFDNLPNKGVVVEDLSKYIKDYYVLQSSKMDTLEPTIISADIIDGETPSLISFIQYGSATIQYVSSIEMSGAKIIKINNDANPQVVKFIKSENKNSNINFLSYNYSASNNDGVTKIVSNAYYFGEQLVWNGETPVASDVYNMFIVTKKAGWDDATIKVGDYVYNKTYYNKEGDAAKYNLIPGITRIIKKQFIQVNRTSLIATYKGQSYKVNNSSFCDTDANGNYGFYLFTTTAPVATTVKDASGELNNSIKRLKALSDDSISSTYKFIPMKGLEISSRHRPGYDKDGNLNIEKGIEKIYSILEDEGIHRGLLNKELAEFRYVIDSMSYGIAPELGGKVYLSRLAKDRGKSTAILNLPSFKQFAVSSNPYFCDTYITGVNTRPGLNTKYIAEGGNTEMGSTVVFSLPSYDNGADYTACFWPHLVYQENGREFPVPPAADVCNVLYRKFTGLNDPYGICANQTGILSNNSIKKLEFEPDQIDRDYLESFGVNCLIKDRGNIMIYGNQTAYQSVKSDKNKLHVRENLNTLEIECDNIARKFNFKYNTATLRTQVVQEYTTVLSVMQTSGAIDSFTITCDETNNTAEVISQDVCIVDVTVVMNHGMEKIIQRFTLNRRSE